MSFASLPPNLLYRFQSYRITPENHVIPIVLYYFYLPIINEYFGQFRTGGYFSKFLQACSLTSDLPKPMRSLPQQ